MANYLYKTVLYTDTSSVIGVPSSNASDLSDFETNHKATALPASELVIAETTIITELSYADFDADIATPLDWSDVRYVDNGTMYTVFLITANPI